ncbi:DNA modification system-associated small protein [Burkholderia pseudomallei]|uniref:DNA modification system-associated small protein n=1 Tax=Burkholderia pseudomallei TaxID=28450 RepID=UPI00071825D4|nr:DNA modification system-associated small protein [Burkholderia pseudomallei]
MSDVFLGDLPLWSDADARAVLEQLCVKHGVPMDVLEDLVGIQRERSGEERARNVYPRIEETLSRMD